MRMENMAGLWLTGEFIDRSHTNYISTIRLTFRVVRLTWCAVYVCRWDDLRTVACFNLCWFLRALSWRASCETACNRSLPHFLTWHDAARQSGCSIHQHTPTPVVVLHWVLLCFWHGRQWLNGTTSLLYSPLLILPVYQASITGLVLCSCDCTGDRYGVGSSLPFWDGGDGSSWRQDIN